MPSADHAAQQDTRAFAAEAVGTFAVTFVSGAALMQSRNADAGAGLMDVALAHGFIVAVMLSAFLRLGASLNPAFALGLLVTGRVSAQRAGAAIAGQLLGALIAAFTLKGVFPPELWEAARGARQLVSLDVTTAQAFALEAIATAVVMVAYMGTVADPRGAKLGGVAVGLAASAAFVAIGPLTGASMNPARTLAPMIVSRAFEGLALYLTAPIVGAVVAAVIYQQLLLRTDQPTADDITAR